MYTTRKKRDISTIEHTAVRLLDKGKPILTKAGTQIGVDGKGVPIYKAVTCELWELDGYETAVPQGYVPYWDERLQHWFRAPKGSKLDPMKQLGFLPADDVSF